MKNPLSPTSKNPRRPVLLLGACLLGISAALFFSPLQSVSPWFLLAGTLLVLLWFVLDKLAATPVATRRLPESTLFRQTTVMDEPPRDESDRAPKD
jgi:hypothetical protein